MGLLQTLGITKKDVTAQLARLKFTFRHAESVYNFTPVDNL